MVTEGVLLFVKNDHALIFFAFKEKKFFCAHVQPFLKGEQVGDDAMER